MLLRAVPLPVALAGRIPMSTLRRRRGGPPCHPAPDLLLPPGLRCTRRSSRSGSGFWAIFLFARHKKSISALQLMADLGIGSYRTAWLLLHKIRGCFDESPDYPLVGLVEMD